MENGVYALHHIKQSIITDVLLLWSRDTFLHIGPTIHFAGVIGHFNPNIIHFGKIFNFINLHSFSILDVMVNLFILIFSAV